MSLLPDDPKARKEYPIYEGFIKYFPDAVAAVSHVSFLGGQQHNPGKPLFWDRTKSGDQADTLLRHQIDWDQYDKDGVPHCFKVAWRAMAQAQLFIEKLQAEGKPVFKVTTPKG